MVKDPPANAGGTGDAGQDDLLEEDRAAHSSWGVPWTEEPGRLHKVTDSDMTEAT